MDAPARQTSFRYELSEKLREMDLKPTAEQSEFWQSCALTKSQELEDIGGLAPDEIYNDVLNQFFDSSVSGLRSVFDLCLRDQDDQELAKQDLLSKEGLQDAVVEHFQYYRTVDPEMKQLDGEAEECFNRFCDVVGVPTTVHSFAYGIRRLRLGILIKLYKLAECSITQVYHIDYDDDFIHTPFVDKAIKHKERWCRGTRYQLPVLDKQPPLTGSALETYFFTNKMTRKGNVHWVHLQRPEVATVLAIGQVYRMPGTVQSTMRNMRKSQPVIHLSKKMKKLTPIEDLNHNFVTLSETLRKVQTGGKPDDAPEIISPPDKKMKKAEPAFEWSALIYPGMAMDYASRRSLEDYERWYMDRQKKRRTSDNADNGSKQVHDGPPPLYVACVEFRISIIWSDVGTNTIVTACGPASYIGKWITDVETWEDGSDNKSQGWWCCRRAQRNVDLGPKYGATDRDTIYDDVEALGPPPSARLIEGIRKGQVDINSEAARGMEAVDAEASCITFDGIFEKTLQALARQNSLLRTGTNEQLMTRIILNSTQEFVKIAELYEAGILRITTLLNTLGVPDKNHLIAKVEDAKLELAQMLRIVEPFEKYVIPTLEEMKSPSDVVTFNLKNIQNDVHTFTPKCESLLKQCESLTEEYDRKAADKMNTILNILTFITFVITPCQILTGLYGMNFRIMPELQWRHGYLYFWSLSIFLSLLFAGILYKFTKEQ